jgi:cell wall-associated NlpC family hydrolase
VWPRFLFRPMGHVLTRVAALCAVAVGFALGVAHASSGSTKPPVVEPTAASFTAAYDRLERRRAEPRRVVPTVGERAARLALRYLGSPYSYGGASPAGFDCSGFVMYVYAKLGVALPHHAASQYGLGRSVPYSALRPGDLVFFSGLGHVGLYVGKGRFVDAPQSGDVVRVRPLAERRDSYVGARRIASA